MLFRSPSESMESTLLVGDFLLVNKQVASSNADGSASFLPSAASAYASSTVFGAGSPQAFALSASLVGFPFFIIGPVGLVNIRTRKDPLRRIFSGVFAGPFTPGLRFAPSRNR